MATQHIAGIARQPAQMTLPCGVETVFHFSTGSVMAGSFDNIGKNDT